MLDGSTTVWYNKGIMTAGRTINSQSVHWGTPIKYVDAVRKMFCGKIDLDPCSNEWSIVGARVEYCLPEKDGLKELWLLYNTIYVNPPYGRDKERGTSIKDWLRKCHKATSLQSQVLALIPVATNTSHWKEHVWGGATAICFLADTRLRFLINGEDTGKGAPMACAMVYWGPHVQYFRHCFHTFGAVINV